MTEIRVRSATMQDVARVAGVSTMTVSNVVNGRSARVGDSTRDRVLQTISDLGYRVNATARSLRSGRTGVVGLAVPDLSSGYYGELADRLARRLIGHGLRLAVERTGGELTAELDTLASAHLDAYDALVLALSAGSMTDLDQLQPDKPVVLIGERAVSDRFHRVRMDNVGGARLATEHLLDGGSRAVLVLGGRPGDQDSVQELRVRGYRDALEARGLPFDPDLVLDCTLDAVRAHQAVTDAIASGIAFDGLFAVTDTMATGALRALADAGFTVPGQVPVVGFDNLRSSAFTVPGLTTVEPGNDEMADAVCSMLLAQLTATPADGGPRLAMPSARLVVRGSTRSRR